MRVFTANVAEFGSECAKRASLGTSDMIKRRVFLGGTLSAVAVESCKTQSAEAPVPTAAIQPLEPLVWPIVTKLPDGIRAFAGHVNTVPDRKKSFTSQG